jgi:hypothetical protein
MDRGKGLPAFLVQHAKKEKIYQMTIKYTKRPLGKS